MDPGKVSAQQQVQNQISIPPIVLLPPPCEQAESRVAWPIQIS